MFLEKRQVLRIKGYGIVAQGIHCWHLQELLKQRPAWKHRVVQDCLVGADRKGVTLPFKFSSSQNTQVATRLCRG